MTPDCRLASLALVSGLWTLDPLMARQLRLTVVTPETTLLDEPVDSVRLPLFDGMIGIFPRRAPMVGRLGYGEMTVRTGGEVRIWFVDGGFVQVADDVCSVLTNRAVPPQSLDAADAERRLAEASKVVPRTEAGFDAKFRDQERARRTIAVARKSR